MSRQLSNSSPSFPPLLTTFFCAAAAISPKEALKSTPWGLTVFFTSGWLLTLLFGLTPKIVCITKALLSSIHDLLTPGPYPLLPVAGQLYLCSRSPGHYHHCLAHSPHCRSL